VTVTGIDHVQVAAPPGCEEAARAFYCGVLGLEELPKPEALRARGGCWFRAGAQELHVGVEEPFAPARKAHPGLVVSGLRDLTARLLAAGVEVGWDESIPGAKRVHVVDPFGNRLELRDASTQIGAFADAARVDFGDPGAVDPKGADMKFTTEDAQRIGTEIGIDWPSSRFDVEEFRRGMDVELEHGRHDLATDVTGDDPHTTGKIARAHLNEFPDYYTRLAKMEDEAKRELAAPGR
jgi:catechol 2,3-dioxygenase-like lactoylglutathione lyase family enzyme